MDTDSTGSHLSVILDLSPSHWHLSAQAGLPLDLCLSQLLAFFNSHIALKHENSLAVYGALPGKSVPLYSSSETIESPSKADANTFPAFRLVDTTVLSRIKNELDFLGQPEEEAPPGMVGCLMKALCYINRITSSQSSSSDKPEVNQYPDPRILILSVSPDLSTSYISIMNAIFSAQKLKATIDVCQLYGPNTVFLQQAAHLTGGSYIALEHHDALLQYLMMSFLSPPSVRQTLSVPTQEKIDFRAACFCHKNIVDIGYVCSVCLSIFCNPIPVCSTCRTKFPVSTVLRLRASKPSNATPMKANNAIGTGTPRSRPATPTLQSSNGLPNSNSISLGR